MEDDHEGWDLTGYPPSPQLNPSESIATDFGSSQDALQTPAPTYSAFATHNGEASQAGASQDISDSQTTVPLDFMEDSPRRRDSEATNPYGSQGTDESAPNSPPSPASFWGETRRSSDLSDETFASDGFSPNSLFPS